MTVMCVKGMQYGESAECLACQSAAGCMAWEALCIKPADCAPTYRKWSEAAEFDPSGKAAHEPGAKLDAGKQMAGVLLDFARALGAVADVGTMGARKYSRGGWLSVPEGEQRYMDALMRHLLKLGAGEAADPESGLPHLAHAAWNILAILEIQSRNEGGAHAVR